MKLIVGSKNQIKIAAVEEVIALYSEQFPNPEVVSVDPHVDEFGHPKSLEATIQGAMDRAKSVFNDCAYSFGIEGGLMAVPYTKSGFMEVGACAIYDGEKYHLGLSSAFEWPSQILDLIVNQNLDGSQAIKAAGLTQHDKLGEAEGFVGLLTKGKTNRKEKTKESVMMAVVHLINPDMF